MQIKEERLWNKSDVLEMCIKYGWYNAGSAEDYTEMLSSIETTNPDIENIYKVADDIFKHSTEDGLYVEQVMYVIANEVVKTFYEVIRDA